MTTHLDTDWTWRARRLADDLETRGDLTDPAWKTAVAAVPRHVLVPEAHQQDSTGTWHHLTTDSAEGLDLAYSPTTLVTQLTDRSTHRESTSSGTKPDLIVRMLETLDIHDGHRVLAIGTGTGYTTALLSHRLGDRNVCSVDIDPELVEAARTRLASLGYHPTLAARDGADGLAEYAPYERIIATCSVPRVPWTWAEQLAPGGAVLVNVKPTVHAGNLVLLHRHPDRLEGRFTDRWVAFMTMRHHTHNQEPPAPRSTTEPRTRSTTTPPSPWWDNRVVWLLAQVHGLPDGVTVGMRLDPHTRQPAAATMTAPDGSTAEVSLTDSTAGRYDVTETGPTPLWEPVEQAHHTWLEHDQPDWPRLGLTATAHHQWLWIDHPDSAVHWPL
ncbi:methyltransferase domain-containing protein [Actinopolyspora mortivallis]|uniref:methyltransferase domain-containing protein n=1 Tax=Actinopolyspora mortivallis TaxID=33906 RepID=UPI000370443F|nr:methyltransferase domain-containing protein [Actinopolyspora mortivallis]